MQELFRFYAIRTPDPVPDQEQIPLETTSSYQATLAGSQVTASSAIVTSRALIDKAAPVVLHDLDTLGNGIRLLKARLDALEPSDKIAPVGEWVRADFKIAPMGESVRADFKQQPLAALAESLHPGTEQLKDVVVALRVLKILSVPRSTGGNVPAVRFPDWINPLENVVPQLILAMRLRTALASAAAGPVTVAYMKGAMTLGLTFNGLDRFYALKSLPSASAAETLAQNKKRLQDLTELIRQVRLACPSFLQFDQLPVLGVTMESAYAHSLANTYKGLINALSTLPGRAVPGTLLMNWVGLHALLEDKAVSFQKIIDDETPASTTPPTPNASSPIVGGHMQLAGVADVHVILNHVVRYEKAELAQIENILLGESRNRTYRTLLRNETDSETTTETTTTQEREVKTEDRSDLKTETDNSLKEVLDLKSGVDIQYKQGDSLKLNLNASVAYNRSKEEASKVATEFAKDVTNRAAQKVVQTVRQSIKTKILRETEETIVHGFDNAAATRTDNVVGIYQWIEKVYENVHLTVGGPAAIFDGVVLQPAQRLLTTPPSADGALGSATPPPPLDVQPTDIHPWNYLTLASRFGASGVPPAPPFITSTSFSAATGDDNPQGIAHDIAIPDDTMAAYAAVIFDAQDHPSDAHDHAEARASLGGTLLTSTTASGHATFHSTVMLSGERGMVPFAALFYQNLGYELTVDVTCVRTLETYQRWQLSVHAALASAPPRPSRPTTSGWLGRRCRKLRATARLRGGSTS
jgi:hypothetical protein